MEVWCDHMVQPQTQNESNVVAWHILSLKLPAHPALFYLETH